MTHKCDISRAYLYFCESILRGGEGIFMSQKTEKSLEFFAGMGGKKKHDFDAGIFPVFSLTDFTGEEQDNYSFEQFFSSTRDIDDFFSHDYTCRTGEALDEIFADFSLPDVASTVNISQDIFESMIEEAREAQYNGEVWVINLAHCLSGSMDDPRVLLAFFREFLKKDYFHLGGLIWTDECKAVSFSPETFIWQRGDRIRTFPIKGTGSQSDLKKSTKEHAELSMITDLMRNDLGQIGENVVVEEACHLQAFKKFYHTHAEISARLPQKYLEYSDFKKLLPAGSVSGCPKVRATKYIQKLENFSRKFFTGTLGVRISAEDARFNILIRTMFWDQGMWKFPVGAGITVKSDPTKEWEETLLKADVMWDLWESFTHDSTQRQQQ